MDPLKLFDEAKEELLRTEARRAKATSADKTNELPDGEARSLRRFGSGLPCDESILSPYISDPKNDGTYILNLSHEETMKLWDEIDAQTKELMQLKKLNYILCRNWEERNLCPNT